MGDPLVAAQPLASTVVDDAAIGFDPEVWRNHLTVQLDLPQHRTVRNTLLGQTRHDQAAHRVALDLCGIQIVKQVLQLGFVHLQWPSVGLMV